MNVNGSELVTTERLIDEAELRYDLRRPCADCPFRRDVPKHEGFGSGLAELYLAMFIMGTKGHTCHMTDPMGDSLAGQRFEGPLQHCAGALILMRRESIEPPSSVTRAIDDGRFDFDQLEDAGVVYGSLEMLQSYAAWARWVTDEVPQWQRDVWQLEHHYGMTGTDEKRPRRG